MKQALNISQHKLIFASLTRKYFCRSFLFGSWLSNLQVFYAAFAHHESLTQNWFEMLNRTKSKHYGQIKTFYTDV